MLNLYNIIYDLFTMRYRQQIYACIRTAYLESRISTKTAEALGRKPHIIRITTNVTNIIPRAKHPYHHIYWTVYLESRISPKSPNFISLHSEKTISPVSHHREKNLVTIKYMIIICQFSFHTPYQQSTPTSAPTPVSARGPKARADMGVSG